MLTLETTLLIELHCLPGTAYYREIIRHDKLLIEKCENYQKRTCRNRFYLDGPNGMARFTIPLVQGKNEQMPIDKVLISYDEDWIKNLTNLLRTYYNRSPFFCFYEAELIDLISRKYKTLFEMNIHLLRWTFEIIGISVRLHFTKTYKESYAKDVNDVRNLIRPNQIFIRPEPMVTYSQVFEEKNGFIKNLSILDMIFCCGPETYSILSVG